MKHKDREAQPEPVTGWQQTMRHKHQLQMQLHENAYGKLGRLQTKSQKNRLKQDIARGAK